MAPPVEQLLTVAQAMAILDAEPVSRRTRRVTLEKSAGLVLAEDIPADRDYPPFDKSVMDGYAVREVDVTVAPTQLKVVGEIAAGQMPARGIGPGEAMAIMTGAPMPPGADAVIPVEWTHDDDGTQVVIEWLGQAGQTKIVRRGSDSLAGATVLSAGTLLGPAQIAVAASVGAATVSVYERPRVAVMSSGDEIVPIGAAPGPAQIRNSNSAMLAALIRGRGWCSECMELASPIDQPEAVAEALRAARGYDAIFLSGGMSMGKYDFVPRVLGELGVTMKISKLRIKPGKPFGFGAWGGTAGGETEEAEFARERGRRGRDLPDSRPPAATCVFGLPGNPVSAFVCTLRLASRVLRRMGGESPAPPRKTARLIEAVAANGAREFYQPATWRAGGIAPLHWKGSGDVFSLAAAEALIVRPADDPPRAAGFEVEIVEW